MGRFLLTATITGAVLVLGYQLVSPGPSPRARFAAMRQKMMKRMMDKMPDDSPPKLVMSILPRLQEQNDKIIALLEEQNDLLRQPNAKRS